MNNRARPSERIKYKEEISSILDHVADNHFDGWDNYNVDKAQFQELILNFLDAWALTCKARRDYREYKIPYASDVSPERIMENGHSK